MPTSTSRSDRTITVGAACLSAQSATGARVAELGCHREHGRARREHHGMSRHQCYSEQEFEALVRSALDDLPTEFQRALENVAIVVSDRGAEHHAYGMYHGLRRGGGNFFGGGGTPDEILIFRDTLVRDFGDDPDRLRSKVNQTLRHEVGHYFGFDEMGVRRLGL
jgi:predicted Zn-dependent protease with MMP-like domain